MFDYVVVRSDALDRDVAIAKSADGEAAARRDRPDLEVWTVGELDLLDASAATADDVRFLSAARKALDARVVDPCEPPEIVDVRRIVACQKTTQKRNGSKTTKRWTKEVVVKVPILYDVFFEAHGSYVLPRAFVRLAKKARENALLRGRA